MEWKNPDGSLTGGVVIEDGAGNKLGTAANPLNVTGGGGGGSNASVGVTGSAVPVDATAIGYQNASGNLAIPSASAGLPISDTGASATGVSQPPGGSGLSGWLSGIYSKLTGTLSVSWSGQSVSVSSLPAIPAGANAIGTIGVTSIPDAAFGSGSTVSAVNTAFSGLSGLSTAGFAKLILTCTAAGTANVTWRVLMSAERHGKPSLQAGWIAQRLDQ